MIDGRMIHLQLFSEISEANTSNFQKILKICSEANTSKFPENMLPLHV